jgi:hypothetical protein
MVTEFKDSSLELFRAVGYPENVQRNQYRDDEPYHVWMAVEALNNHAWKTLGEDKYQETYWPINSRVMDALRAALNANKDNYAAMHLARALVRGKCRDPEVMASLNGWDRMMFTWIQEGITVETAAAALQRSGFVETFSAESIQALNSWLLNPLRAINEAWDIVTSLFGDNVVFALLRDNFDAEHHTLLGELFAKAKPPIEVADLQQTIEVPERLVPVPASENPEQQATVNGHPVYVDAAEYFVVSFSHAGQLHRLTPKNGGRWMDLDSVLRFFDHFMTTLGRSERVFDLQVEAENTGLIVGQTEPTMHLARQLHIPLVGATTTTA